MSQFITHPEALKIAIETGWNLRLGQTNPGIFHPKLLVAGNRFSAQGAIEPVSFAYVGSSNFTKGGLQRNTECGVLSDGAIDGASDSFSHLWTSSTTADSAAVDNYAAAFAEVNRNRPAAELKDLGVSEYEDLAAPHPQMPRIRPPDRPVVADTFASASWTGLQSFTGDFRFQVEFPRSAGLVVRRLARKASPTGRINVYCTDDRQIREMQFKFYPQNDMFRLNIPNDVPNVAWVRRHHDGVALVQQGLPGGAPLRLTIMLPGNDANELIARSKAMDSWGQTPTRLYGWF
ncbi:MAG TPA: phospholipase D-like domain-containing protein [Lacunisphaera sp.]|nr:phospholipase D-like domain-containing protein [Lacunisphaera sp.]